MNFVTIYFQLYHFNIWPQINAPLHNSFRKIYQFADITLRSNFFFREDFRQISFSLKKDQQKQIQYYLL